MDEQLVYHIAQPVRRDQQYRLQLLLTKEATPRVLNAFHDDSVHLGIEKTYAKIRTIYYWPGIYSDVVRHLQQCIPCSTNKLKAIKVNFQDMPIPTIPFEIVAFDIVGPFYPDSGRKNRYILTFICLFSSWLEVYVYLLKKLKW